MRNIRGLEPHEDPYWRENCCQYSATSPTKDQVIFATYLESRNIPWHLIAVDQGNAVPPDRSNSAVWCHGPGR